MSYLFRQCYYTYRHIGYTSSSDPGDNLVGRYR